jgi:hypothetical protein
MDLLPELEEARPSKITLIEEVAGFLRDTKQKVSPGKQLYHELERIFGSGHVAMVNISSDIWVEGKRDRRICNFRAQAVIACRVGSSRIPHVYAQATSFTL